METGEKIIVSIVMPIYNSEKTLRRAIESVKQQSFQRWELLLINDGSTDGSIAICQEYVRSDSRIKYFEQENAGPARARNSGIEKSSGKYISFIDSDDSYTPEFIKTMYESIIATNSDMAICGVIRKCVNGDEILNQPIGEKRITNVSELKEYLRFFYHGNPGAIASLCNKMYSADLIRNYGVRLDETKHHGEDWKFNLDLLKSGEVRIVGVDKALYQYIKQENSQSSRYFPDKRLQIFDSAELLLSINKKFDLREELSVYAELIQNITGHALLISKNHDKQSSRTFIKELLQHSMTKEACRHISEIAMPGKFKSSMRLLRIPYIGIPLFRIIAKVRR